ncbi:ATP-dependent (S)-NAD(P)H-hydrate dehydratase, related [Eimeria tenella]|uniref:ATP-dependent (S)-NAD(P)H-hydrate dehydratase n=1 Tax=Eimeria tenella TaxID=5802 RepID=U6KUV2_EIMTE|nr:ATP-dependent (S)-NAD(P)H-hydrate dehydratase, related [Eimeria tenella]CDJ41907.1 ATP-dependent (S)-NAD(P)H-hydrate dehydratase, related [Eimeria tenella]|eukprot:XP_013232657.1 ATP-dependent (S)-NAD(P)H-hydrate dehydratase, related [Eimeria tenella]
MFGCLRGLCRPHCSNLSVTIRATPCLLRLQRQQQLLNTYLLHTCNNYGEYRASLAVEAAARRITPEPSSQLALEQGSASMSSTLQPQSKMASLLVLTKEEVDMAQKATDGWLKVVERALLTPLDFKEHKGRYGKVCVIGGSATFTGAPYFAASAALRMGADLATVITTPSAAMAIKAYSPELLVYPILPCRYGAERGKPNEQDPFDYQLELARLKIHAEPLLRKVDVVVIGPGLGGSSNYRFHEEHDTKQQQAQQQQHPRQGKQQEQQEQQHKQKSLDKSGSGGRLSHFLREAIDDVHKVVRGSSSSSVGADHKAAATATDRTNPATIDHAITKQAILEAEAAAAVTQKAAIFLLRLCMQMKKPLVLDADMLRILSIPGHEHYLSLLEGYDQAVLTPNGHELEQLLRALRRRQAAGDGEQHGPKGWNNYATHGLLPASLEAEGVTQHLAETVALLRGPCVFAKGRVDLLGAFDAKEDLEDCPRVYMAVAGLDPRYFGSPKRSGGQGDVLCGVLAEALVWSERGRALELKQVEEETAKLGLVVPFGGRPSVPYLFLMHAASLITRQAAFLAYKHHGRSMTAEHILDRLSAAAAIAFPSSWIQQSSL